MNCFQWSSQDTTITRLLGAIFLVTCLLSPLLHFCIKFSINTMCHDDCSGEMYDFYTRSLNLPPKQVKVFSYIRHFMPYITNSQDTLTAEETLDLVVCPLISQVPSREVPLLICRLLKWDPTVTCRDPEGGYIFTSAELGDSMCKAQRPPHVVLHIAARVYDIPQALVRDFNNTMHYTAIPISTCSL